MAYETDWRADANCLSVDPNLMQPEAATAAELSQALAVCEGCPVLTRCGELAREHVDSYGIHAGEWFGPLPKRTDVATCQWCGTEVQAERGTRRYCGPACRKAAQRARQAAELLTA